MNMKKTMAAIAACAVAVSAMATTVSAVEDQTLTYDLTSATKTWAKGNVTITGTIAGVDATAAGEYGFSAVPTGYALQTLTITVKDTSGGAGSKAITYSTDWNADNYTSKLWNGKSIELPANTFSASTADVTITGTFTHSYGEWAAQNGTVAGDFGAVTALASGTATAAPLVATGYTQPTKTVLESPMETTLNNNYDIIDYLEGDYLSPVGKMYLNGEDKNYVNVVPVLNDAIENYETVTFQFNSAKDYVRFEAVVNGELTGEKGATKAVIADKVENKVSALSVEKGELQVALKEAKDAVVDPNAPTEAETAAIKAAQGAVDAKQKEIDNWMNYKTMWYYTSENYDSTDYSTFTQHLYNGLSVTDYFAAEGTNYLGLDWAGYNLFQGGLVINEGLTMSLADTTMFDWGKSSVSFDWDTIADAAQTTNNYALYLHSMELATSVDWYWDSLDVILTAGAVDDATSDAGAEADDEVLDDEEIVEDEVVEEEIVEEEIVEEEVVEEEVVEEVEVENPTTGNASVALAVIPVALAAAAVVAKKRS